MASHGIFFFKKNKHLRFFPPDLYHINLTEHFVIFFFQACINYRYIKYATFLASAWQV